MELEIWKNIYEYGGAYQISNYGRIRSWVYYTGNGHASQKIIIDK